MGRSTANFALVLLTMIGLLLGLSQGRAHEGHDHGAPPPPVGITVAPRAEASSLDFELVAIARGGELVIYLDAFQTNSPIPDATIEIDTPAGLLKPAAKEPGVYSVAAPFVSKPGSYDLAITVTAHGTVDVLATTLKIPNATMDTVAPAAGAWLVGPAIARDLKQRVAQGGFSFWGTLAVGFAAGVLFAGFIWRRWRTAEVAAALMLGAAVLQPPPASADTPPPSVVRDIAQRSPDGAVFVPKPTQQILALRTVLTEERVHSRAVELPGRIVPSPNASGLVQASIGGR